MIPVTRRFTLRGDCMLPLLEPGDEVWVRPGDGGPLVAFARIRGRVPEIVVHRLLADGRTRADARLARDPAGAAEARVGRVVAVRRGGRVAALDGRRGRLWTGLAGLYARAFLSWWREGVLNPLEEAGDGPLRRALRGAALAPPRFAFRLLFGPRARP